MTTRKAVLGIVAVYLAAMLAMGTARATSVDRWTHYRDRRTGNVLIVKTACITAEDSAAHLRLADYADNGGRIVIGCSRKGY